MTNAKDDAVEAVALKPVAWRTEYRDVYQGRDTGWHFVYHTTEPHPLPVRNGCGHRNVTPLYDAAAIEAMRAAQPDTN
jgi:hypothetical protein